jgi:hypothetical protein
MVFIKFCLSSNRHADGFAPLADLLVAQDVDAAVAGSFSCLHSNMCKKAAGTDIEEKKFCEGEL